MNYFCFTFVFVLAFINMETSTFRSKYKDLYEKLDFDSLLKNNRLVSLYIRCLLNKNKCNKEGLVLRDAIPEIIETTCGNCTEKERDIVRKVMNFIYTNRNADFEKIYEQFDPERIHRIEVMNFMFNNAIKTTAATITQPNNFASLPIN
ncbi:hypothetical protein PGB90_000776 [Kerria lacca]